MLPSKVTVIGAGPSGLMAAEVLAKGGVDVTILDHMPSPARKFLLAGRGGLNLTHSEPLETFLTRYGEAKDFLEPAIRAFPPQAVIDWCNGLGIETFVGSSGRVFPKQMKASPLLRAWLRRLQSLGVTLKTRERWQGFDGTPTILAMGGASWPHLGSDAAWVPLLRA
ncbi:MAG: NAD(P)/FAD-dependent oxidoreductase, partial [Rhizobiales bacterium]|nr:NAD(P)/FAD-dependent oxidoreductase [Hyphomicrobiales bacterium]